MSGKLDKYRAQRDFGKTGEPSGGKRLRRGDPVFVIQQHDATNLHFDFPLQVDDVLVSWAVPKGPSTGPREKRLAIRTEDHPGRGTIHRGPAVATPPRSP